MRRRHLLACPAAALPAGAKAQQPQRLPRVGILFLRPSAELGPSEVLIVPRLRDFGWIDGKTVHIEYRYSDSSDYDRLALLAAELVAAKVDVIVTYAAGVLAARRAPSTIPIVHATGGDPVGLCYPRNIAPSRVPLARSALFSSRTA